MGQRRRESRAPTLPRRHAMLVNDPAVLIMVRDGQRLGTHRDAREATLHHAAQRKAGRAAEEAQLPLGHRAQVAPAPAERKTGAHTVVLRRAARRANVEERVVLSRTQRQTEGEREGEVERGGERGRGREGGDTRLE
jgi:hypothetical protein